MNSILGSKNWYSVTIHINLVQNRLNSSWQTKYPSYLVDTQNEVKVGLKKSVYWMIPVVGKSHLLYSNQQVKNMLGISGREKKRDQEKQKKELETVYSWERATVLVINLAIGKIPGSFETINLLKQNIIKKVTMRLCQPPVAFLTKRIFLPRAQWASF